MEVKSIYLVDDDLFFAKSFTKRLEKINEYEIKHFSSSDEALEHIENDNPEVLFLDHLMRGTLGIDAIPDFRKLVPKCEIAVVTSLRDEKISNQAKEAGATNCFTKDTLLMDNTKEFLSDVENSANRDNNFWDNFLS